MNAIEFNGANKRFGPPPGMDESQVMTVHAHVGQAQRGSCEGSPMIVTCWQPTDEDRALIAAGGAIYMTMLANGLPPHYLSTTFADATNPA